ncbi:MAG: leucine-rich repeat domain-containing protein [Oscillospiraceae bacterium]|nr:leucine-rich repeat domain-containing protein [Oscillospiraceae bacterium]
MSFEISDGILSRYTADSAVSDVVIPDGVTTIGTNAFADCVSLTDITIPDNVEYIETAAFSNCTNLKNVKLPDSLIRIGEKAFYGCSSLSQVKIPEGVTEIGYEAFCCCTDLSDVVISGTVTKTGCYAFAETPWLDKKKSQDPLVIINSIVINGDSCTGDVVIPDGIRKIADMAFYNSRNMTSLTLPDSISYVGKYALKNTSGIRKIYYKLRKNGFTYSIDIDEKTDMSEIFELFIEKYYFKDIGSLKTDLVLHMLCSDIRCAEFYVNNSINDIVMDIVKNNDQESARKLISSDYIITRNNIDTFIGYTYIFDNEEIRAVFTEYKNNSRNINNTQKSQKMQEDEENETGWKGNNNNEYKYRIRGSKASIIECSYEASDLDICPNVNGIPVTSIENGAFKNSRLSSVIIPSVVTEVGKEAFKESSGLETVTLSEGLISIGDEAFKWCESLYDITIPGSLKNIGKDAFSDCTQLEDLIIKNGLKYLSNSMFSGCKSLETVTLPDSIIRIEGYAFENCESLRCINIPKNTSYIEGDAFSGCSNLTEIKIHPDNTNFCFEDGFLFSKNKSMLVSCIDQKKSSICIPESVSIIEKGAFLNFRELKEVKISHGVCIISAYAFYRCEKLASVFIPDTVKCIEANAFGWCQSLQSITISDGVLSIAGNAFWSCRSLKSVSIPASVKNIAADAFEACHELESVNVSDENMNYCSVDGVLYNKDKTKLIFCPCENQNDVIIPPTVREIEKGAFKNCSYIKKVIIPDGVERINDYTFYECTSLVSVSLPDTLCSIGVESFRHCKSLSSLIIPDHVTSIPYGAFFASGIKNIKLSDSLIDIGKESFSNSSVTSIKLPDGFTSIGSYAFNGCNELTYAGIPDSCTDIGDSAFYSCKNLSAVNIPGSVKKINRCVFYKCEGLETVTIAEGCQSIGEKAFYGCSGLKTLIIPESLTDIDDSSFEECPDDYTINGTPASDIGVLNEEDRQALITLWEAEKYINKQQYVCIKLKNNNDQDLYIRFEGYTEKEVFQNFDKEFVTAFKQNTDDLEEKACDYIDEHFSDYCKEYDWCGDMRRQDIYFRKSEKYGCFTFEYDLGQNYHAFQEELIGYVCFNKKFDITDLIVKSIWT